MLKIKLKSNGKIHQRSFRIIIAPDRSKSNGKFVDDLGFYTPQTKTLQIDKKKMSQWLKNGAQLTEGVDKLLHPDKYPRVKKIKKVAETNQKPPEVSKPEDIKKEEVKVEEKIEKVEEVKKDEEKTQEVIEEKVAEVKEVEEVKKVEAVENK